MTVNPDRETAIEMKLKSLLEQAYTHVAAWAKQYGAA